MPEEGQKALPLCTRMAPAQPSLVQPWGGGGGGPGHAELLAGKGKAGLFVLCSASLSATWFKGLPVAFCQEQKAESMVPGHLNDTAEWGRAPWCSAVFHEQQKAGTQTPAFCLFAGCHKLHQIR